MDKNTIKQYAAEISNVTSQVLTSGKASSRTLALLEQERIKYQFFASMSEEIQFEYNEGTDLLSLSDWGAAQLGLSEILPHPRSSEALSHVLRPEDLADLAAQLKKARPENPIVHATYALQVKGEKRWFNVVARPLWVGDELSDMTGTIGKFLDVHEEHLQIDALKKRAEQDSLTLLYNHMSARKLVETALEQRHADSCAMILMDLDYFKTANDHYGHMFGDAVLKHVAQSILRNIRREDIAARVGGDEFLIFTQFENEAGAFVQRLFQALHSVYNGFEISISMGVAFFPQNGQTYDELFHRADQALYTAKQRGRNQYQLYDVSVKGALSVLSPMESDFETVR